MNKTPSIGSGCEGEAGGGGLGEGVWRVPRSR